MNKKLIGTLVVFSLMIGFFGVESANAGLVTVTRPSKAPCTCIIDGPGFENLEWVESYDVLRGRVYVCRHTYCGASNNGCYQISLPDSGTGSADTLNGIIKTEIVADKYCGG